MASNRNGIGLIALVATCGACSGVCWAQSEPVSTDPSVAEAGDLTGLAEIVIGPQNLPGREKGDRDRVAAAAKPAEVSGSDEPFWTRERLTGDWWGGRSWLESKGVEINGSFTYHLTTVVDGGSNERASGRSLWDVNALIDLDVLAGWSGARIFANFQSSDDRGRLGDSGSFQLPGNIEYGRNIDEVGELWLEQNAFDDVLRVKVGKIDANSEFAYVNAAADFLNSSASASPTIQMLPTVPAQATGVVVFVYPWDKVYVGGGFFDGATQDGIRTGGRGPADFFSDSRSDSWYWIGEIGCGWAFESLGEGRAAIGGWHATGDFARFDANIEKGTEGLYALVEQQVWASDKDDAEKGVFVFAQYGWADKDVALIGQHASVGAAWRGVCEARGDDSLGAYWSVADASKGSLTGADRDEHAFEVYYKAQITPWVYVQPNAQFFVNPSGRSGIEDSTVLGLQVGITF